MKKFLSSIFAFLLWHTAANAQIVITEIMFNPPEAGTDSLEYIEIHNSGTFAVNLDGWSFSGVDLVFSGVNIPAGGYILTALRPSAMQSLFGKQAIAWAGGALSNGGETIKLLNSSGATVDEITYDDAAPWPTGAAGNGPSIELCNPVFDNAIAENWKEANHNTGVTINNKTVFATPGEANTVSCLPSADHEVAIQDFFFAPADITINQGESVIFVNLQGTHNVNGTQATFPANPASFSSGAPAPATWFFIDTFDVPGVYAYRCDVHFSQGMNGKITVVPQAVEKIVISEFMYNDPGADSLEYIEIYNNGTAATDISGYAFTQGIDYVFPPGTIINPGQYLVIAKFSSTFTNYFGFSPALEFVTGALTNTGEDLELRNANNEVIDYLDYLPTAPWDPGANGGGSSLVLCDPNSDNGLPGSWRAASTPAGFSVNGVPLFANPGAASGCPTAIEPKDDNVGVLSGQPITINVLQNDYLPNPATVLSVTLPAHGSAIVNADKTVLYKSVAGYCGSDEFQYTVGDGVSSATATVKVAVKCFPKYQISQVTNENLDGVADSVGVFCEVRAIVYGINYNAAANGLSMYIIDNQGNGINVFRQTGTLGYAVTEGDDVSVRGKIDQFRGLTEIIADSIIKHSANNPLLPPTVVTKLGENTESKLVQLNNLQLVNPAQWTTGSGTGGFNVFAVAPANPNDTILIRIDNDCELYNAPVPANPFNAKGIGGQFDATSPFTSGYQLLPRYAPDIMEIVGTDAADFSRNVKISPNPASDKLFIRSDLAFDQIQIFSPQGSLLKNLTDADLEEVLDLQSFASGVYFVRFDKDGLAWTTRFLKF